MSAVAVRLEEIKTRGGIRGREVAQLLDTTPETVSRWTKGKNEPQRQSLERLLALEWVMEQLSELFSPAEARLWLFSHHRQLKGQRPADRLQAGATDEVLALIDQIRDGAFI